MAFPPSFLEELRARLPTSDVVGRRVPLKRAGREMRGLCPFHKEKTPSFWVNDQKGFFHCFGCGAHGDVVGFVMRYDNLSFPEAVERLAADAGMEVPRATPQERARFEREKTLYDVVEAAARFFEDQLFAPAGRAALAYLRGRGVDDEAIAQFRLGYAPADAQALRRALAERGFSEQLAVEAGLLRRPDDGRSPYAFFRDRVMFPVADRRGRVVAFGGRVLSGDGPKYVNSADNPIFHKGLLLYAMSRARAAAAKGEELIVAEGYMDVIALRRAGFGGAVAPLGTALTESQIEILWKLAPEGGLRAPVLCFDGDAAGQRAARRAVERILPKVGPDRTARIAFMPAGEDPDSLIRKGGAAAMRQVLAAAVPMVDFVWDMAKEGRGLDTPEALAGFKAELERLAARVEDRATQEAYRREYGNRHYALTREAGRRAFLASKGAAHAASGGKLTKRKGEARRVPPTRAETARRMLVLLVLRRPQIFERIEEDFARFEIPPGPLDNLRREIITALAADPDLDVTCLNDHLNDRGFSEFVRDLASSAGFLGRNAVGDSIDDAIAAWRELFVSLHEPSVMAELTERLVDGVRGDRSGAGVSVQILKQIDRRLNADGESDDDGGNPV